MVKRPSQNSAASAALNVELDAPRTRQGQLTLDLGHTPSHEEADFIASEGNSLAFEHVLSFPQWPAPLTLITGPAKSGKSHLARIWLARADAIAARADDLEVLAGQGGTQPVLIEDADRMPYVEVALFHLLNQSMRDNRPVLMTARVPVEQWPYSTADVLSRARLAARFDVEAPDDIQLSHMLVKLFADRQIVVDPKIISYLVARMERSTEEAVRLVELMDRLALTRHGPITRAIAAEALAQRTAKPVAAGDNDHNE